MVSGVSNTRRLRSLLNAAKQDQGMTLDAIVARTEGRLRRSRVDLLLREQYRAAPLSRDDLLVIAEGFGVDYDGVRLAHLADMGLLGEEDHEPAAIALDLPAGADQLTDKQRAAVRAVIRAMVDPGGPMSEAEAVERERMRAVLHDAEATQNGGADAGTATPEPLAKPPRKGRR